LVKGRATAIASRAIGYTVIDVITYGARREETRDSIEFAKAAQRSAHSVYQRARYGRAEQVSFGCNQRGTILAPIQGVNKRQVYRDGAEKASREHILGTASS